MIYRKIPSNWLRYLLIMSWSALILVSWLSFTDSAQASFRITSRFYPLPPFYRPHGYWEPTVSYQKGVFLVYHAYHYWKEPDTFRVKKQVFGARVSPQGRVLDTLPIPISLWTNGWDLSANNASWLGPPSDSTCFLAIWESLLSPSSDTSRLMGVRFGLNGVLIDSLGLPLLNYHGKQGNYCSVSGDSLFLLIWLDYRKGNYLTYGARIRPDRTALDPDGFRLEPRDSVVNGETALSYNGQVFLAVWDWSPLGSNDVYLSATRVREDGVVLDTVPIRLTRSPASRSATARVPQAASDGRDFFVAFLYEDSVQACSYAAGVRVTGSGVVMDSVPIRISRACGLPSELGLAYNGCDYQVLFTPTGERICGARVSPQGFVKDTVQNPLFPAAPQFQITPNAALGPDGKLLVAWTNNGLPNQYIWGAFLDTTGREVGVEVLQDPPVGQYPEVCLVPLHPNPMRNQGEITFSLPGPGRAQVTVYDALGRKVRMLLDEEVKAGSHRLLWDASDSQGRLLPSGVYFLRLESEGVNLTRKVVVLR